MNKIPDFTVGEKRPNTSERMALRVTRKDDVFKKDFVKCNYLLIVFKDEEKTEADLYMTKNLRNKLVLLSELVHKTWRLKLRVTEAWDESNEHGTNSVHYEGRAADLTVSDKDLNKLPKLAALCVEAGFDFVYYENDHIHVSTK
jgi:hypothetical protein